MNFQAEEATAATDSAVSCPLVVDLDGTLIFTDMLHESVIAVLHENPMRAFNLVAQLSRGRAALKRYLAGQSAADPTILPYNRSFLDWLRTEHASGRRLVLCTATDQLVAHAIAEHVGIFDTVMASDGVVNLSGARKADALELRFGRGGFDYAGNSHKDLAVWSRARRAIVVNASPGLTREAGKACAVERTFPGPARNLDTWRRVLRLHQWLKNTLLFVPLIAAHRIGEIGALSTLVLAFIAFNLCASSVYITNDLVDLASDRQHERKRARPFASGAVSIRTGSILAPLLLLASAAIAVTVGGPFLTWLGLYFVLTCAYSFTLKRLVLVDCLTLAILYTLRVIAGAAAVGMDLSFWLLAFSVFLFLSLAFVKRYAELEILLLSGHAKIRGRGYRTTDAPLVQSLGVVAGYASTLVLALYLNSDAVLKLYRTPEIIWGTVPVMLFWVSWMWLQAHRGNMHEDPLVFAIKDRASQFAGIVFALVVLAGTIGRPW